MFFFDVNEVWIVAREMKRKGETKKKRKRNDVIPIFGSVMVVVFEWWDLEGGVQESRRSAIRTAAPVTKPAAGDKASPVYGDGSMKAWINGERNCTKSSSHFSYCSFSTYNVLGQRL